MECAKGEERETVCCCRERMRPSLLGRASPSVDARRTYSSSSARATPPHRPVDPFLATSSSSSSSAAAAASTTGGAAVALRSGFAERVRIAGSPNSFADRAVPTSGLTLGGPALALASSSSAARSPFRQEEPSARSLEAASRGRTAAPSATATPSVFDTSASRRMRQQQVEEPAGSGSPAVSPSGGRSESPVLNSLSSLSRPTQPFRTASRSSEPSTIRGAGDGLAGARARSPSYWERYWAIGPMGAERPPDSPAAAAREPLHPKRAAAPATSAALAPAPSAAAAAPAPRPSPGSALTTPRGYSSLTPAARQPPSTGFQTGGSVREASATPPSGHRSSPKAPRWTAKDEQLAAAAVSADVARVKALLAEGVRCDVPDTHGDTALHKAVRFDSAPIVRLMCKTKPDANVQGREGRTPLHEAALYNHSQCAAELLVAGTDFDLRDRFRHTAREIGIRQGHAEIVQLIDTYQRLLDQAGLGEAANEPDESSDGGPVAAVAAAAGESTSMATELEGASGFEVVEGTGAEFEVVEDTGAEIAAYESGPPKHLGSLLNSSLLEVATPAPATAPAPAPARAHLHQTSAPAATQNTNAERGLQAARAPISTTSLSLRADETYATPAPAVLDEEQPEEKRSTSPRRAIPDSYVETIFHSLDGDNSGCLSIELVRHAFKELKLTFAGREIAAIPPPDLRGKTKISLSLFKYLVRNRERDTSPTEGSHSPSDLESVYDEMYGTSPIASSPTPALAAAAAAAAAAAPAPAPAPAQSLPAASTNPREQHVSPSLDTPAQRRARAVSWQDQAGSEDESGDQQEAVPTRPNMRINIDTEAMSDAAIASALGGGVDTPAMNDLPIDVRETEVRQTVSRSKPSTQEQHGGDRAGQASGGSKLQPIDTQEMLQLQGLKLKELRRLAKQAGISRTMLEEAMDADDPEEAVIALLVGVRGRAAETRKPSMKIDIDPEAMTNAAIAAALGGADPETATADLPIDAQSTPKRPSMKIDIDPEAMTNAAIAAALGGADPETATADLPI
eukprot:COSAG06_NODE_2047_length_7748_cov_2.928880_1_plen_1024_part_10